MGPEPLSFLEIQTRTGWARTLQGFAEWCSPQPGWRVLDVGCGPGLLPGIFKAAGCTAFGADIDPDLLTGERLHPELLQADACRLPFAERTFDLVTASNLLFLLADPLTALVEFRRVVKPGGQIALLNPSEKMSLSAAAALADERGLQGLARESLLNWARLAETHWRWDSADLNNLMDAAGLHIQASTLKVGEGLARFIKVVRL